MIYIAVHSNYTTIQFPDANLDGRNLWARPVEMGDLIKPNLQWAINLVGIYAVNPS